MSPRTRRVLTILLIALLVLLTLWLARCTPVPPATLSKAARTGSPPSTVQAPISAHDARPEVLSPATIRIPSQVAAGSLFQAEWTGPANVGDYLTVVQPDAPRDTYENYQETRHGTPLDLTAPMEAGKWEVRYVTARSKTVLGRAPLVVTPIAATLAAPDEITLGATMSIAWTGPNNAGDFLTIVPKSAPDGRVGDSVETAKGSPAKLVAPVESGPAEIRYISGQGRAVLARRDLTVSTPDVTMMAEATVIAGAKFSVTWRGPSNSGDYITIVPQGVPDGQYRNYTETAKGSPLELTALIEPGPAELRYMTGRHARVLARRPIRIVAADVSVEAPADAIAGSLVMVTWTGPKAAGDYLTIVPASTPDGQYGNYADASKGSPLKITAPMQPGPAEIRYMSGQGAKVLARRPITITAAEITMKAPAEAAAGSAVAVEWRGPNNAGDYLTVVPKGAKDGTSARVAYTSRGSPAKLVLPKESGSCEIRYMSGQGNLVLGRTNIRVQ